jgi:hypothetical protein
MAAKGKGDAAREEARGVAEALRLKGEPRPPTTPRSLPR